MLELSDKPWSELAAEAEEEMLDYTPGCHLLGVYPHPITFYPQLAYQFHPHKPNLFCLFIEEPFSLLNPLIQETRRRKYYSSKSDFMSLYSWSQYILELEKLTPLSATIPFCQPVYASPEISTLHSVIAEYLKECGAPLKVTQERLWKHLSIGPNTKTQGLRSQIGREVATIYRNLL